MPKRSERIRQPRQPVDPKLLTDDIAYDDIINASKELIVHLQRTIDTYNLTAGQLIAAINIALGSVMPDERLYAAIDGELGGSTDNATNRIDIEQ